MVLETWYLAWGEVDALSGTSWHDRHIACFISNPSQLVLSPSARFVVIGEVWLSQPGKLLQSSLDLPPKSDLELIAIAWERWGVDTLSKLVGMFALAIWDRDEQKLWLARDRTGSRTLYYTTTGNTRWIAPNLRSLAPYHTREVDLVAIRDYLCCAFIPGMQTMWKGVRELRPGTVLQLPENKITAYWQLQENITATEAPLAWHSEKLRSLLEQVIQEYLPQNESVGVFLSGGLDSSCVTALAAKFHSDPVHTFSIHFGDRTPNELEFSSLAAQHCGTQHHILEITFRQMWEKLPEAMRWLDDPIGDPLTVPNLLLGSLAKQSVGVILNGEGGDPCFGGPKNQPMLINQLYNSISQQNSLQAYLLAFQKCASDLPQLFKPEIWELVRDAPHVFTEDLESSQSYLNRLMVLNIKFKGADQILTKVNNLTRGTGLFGLSPLFDQRIVDLSMAIPPEFKLSGVEEKAVLKQAVADLLPETIIRRLKSGMMVPVQMGFREYWQREAKGLLLNRKAAIAPYLDRSLIKQWLNYQGDPWNRYGVKLWLLVSLEIWLQEN
jgi:asparagine synthase (glutamine-hydrolysing)